MRMAITRGIKRLKPLRLFPRLPFTPQPHKCIYFSADRRRPFYVCISLDIRQPLVFQRNPWHRCWDNDMERRFKFLTHPRSNCSMNPELCPKVKPPHVCITFPNLTVHLVPFVLKMQRRIHRNSSLDTPLCIQSE